MGKNRRTAAFVLIILSVIVVASGFGQVTPKPYSPAYRQMQKVLARGWNTWNTNSVLSHVLMPDGLAVNLGIHAGRYMNSFFPSTRPDEVVKMGLRTEDGAYTSLDLSWGGNDLGVQSGHDGDDLVLLVTVRKANGQSTSGLPYLIVESGMLWNREGSVQRQGDRLVAQVKDKRILVQCTAPAVNDPFITVPSAFLAVKLQGEVGICSGRPRTLDEIKQVIARRKSEVEQKAQSYGELGDVFSAIRTVLSWNIIFDPEGERVIIPVSRSWNSSWGGYVMFDWDSYFGACMFSLFNKDLAMANAVEVTKGITPLGFIPNWRGPFNTASYDRSQPPVGSLMVKEIYRRYPEKWFLEEVYDELLIWNRWWPHYRSNRDWLSWGANDVPPDGAAHTAQGAMYESGLDNSPMFDDVPFNGEKNVLELADVGLTSLYVADCQALADISAILGKKSVERELRDRGETYRQALGRLWDEKTGMFLNQRTDTRVFSDRVSPTNFYPLLAKAASAKQAERMVRDHYFNPKEFYGPFIMPSISRGDPGFKDNDYWRGRIWAPMNFLVYLGLRNYSLDQARKDLVQKSKELLLKNWRGQAAVYENLNSVTGQGDDVKNADPFYTWGALLGFISFLEIQR